MAQYYTKINTLYKRDSKNQIIIGDFSNAETEMLKDLLWECSEKIDGTNASIHIIPGNIDHVEHKISEGGADISYNVFDEYTIEIHGKTESARIPSKLLANMQDICGNTDFVSALTYNGIPPQTIIKIFGEGYGEGIQKGGRYTKDQKFIVFDIKIGERYVRRSVVEDICAKMNLDIVPIIGYMTLSSAEEMVKRGFKSLIAEDKTLQAEGLVCKAPMGLLDSQGRRIITKIKTCDYEKLRRCGYHVD